eukprot:CAMPEP_0197523716 /NCGR_PEP_ID=MMETSP1318-20131121/8596_1 /TAXON_ID=552666 /ORGANISM="Partenskyella glossopodia, Strain RCC365" /LENGTH=445 /DNA_ID=CAMNT_0043076503 /DNA_START=70 /DNA_END=1407 /DNA_ORIENTATION=+
MDGEGSADVKGSGNGLEKRFAAYAPFPPLKKRANAARLDNLHQRLKKKLGRRWDGDEDEGPRKAPRKSRDQCTNWSRFSVNDRIVVFQEAANEFLRGTKVWQLIPETSRVAVLDSKLTVQQVIDALVTENQEHVAPVWDSSEEKYLGIASWESMITSLIASKLSLKNFLNSAIRELKLDPMINVSPTHPLMEAIQTCETSEPRTFCIVGANIVPVNEDRVQLNLRGLETFDVLNVFTRKRILRFLFAQLSVNAAGPGISMPDKSQGQTQPAKIKAEGGGANENEKNLFDEILMFTVDQLGIVQRKGVETVTPGSASLKQVLTALVERSLPRVVVLDSQGRAVEMYSKSDIRILSDDVVGALDLDIYAATGRHRRLCSFCTRNDTLQSVMQKMAYGDATAGEVLVCVGPENRYEGLVSFSSLFEILKSKQPSQQLGGASLDTDVKA